MISRPVILKLALSVCVCVCVSDLYPRFVDGIHTHTETHRHTDTQTRKHTYILTINIRFILIYYENNIHVPPSTNPLPIATLPLIRNEISIPSTPSPITFTIYIYIYYKLSRLM
jgi:hypothetical protein